MKSTQARLRSLYFGSDATSRNFRLAILTVDILLLAYFVAASFFTGAAWLYKFDLVVAAFIAADALIRTWVSGFRLRSLAQPSAWADIVVIVSLVLPALVGNLLFLRVLRAMRLFHSYHVLADLRELLPFFRDHEEIIEAAVNLVVFIFVVSAVVFVLQVWINPGINNYVDALYFTVSTVTTTGFGDIVMRDPLGRLLAVVMMVIGFALFVRLVRAVFRADKRRYECTQCGLTEHDLDAAHCKRCGCEIVMKRATEHR